MDVDVILSMPDEVYNKGIMRLRRKRDCLLKQTLEGIYDGDAGRHGERGMYACGEEMGGTDKEEN